MGQIELNCIFILNWIALGRIVLPIKQHTYVKLNCLKWNCFCIQNWIIWNRSYDIEIVLTLNWIVWNRTDLTKSMFILNWIVWTRTVWLNWIAWNRNVLRIKLCTHAKLNSLKYNWSFV